MQIVECQAADWSWDWFPLMLLAAPGRPGQTAGSPGNHGNGVPQAHQHRLRGTWTPGWEVSGWGSAFCYTLWWCSPGQRVINNMVLLPTILFWIMSNAFNKKLFAKLFFFCFCCLYWRQDATCMARSILWPLICFIKCLFIIGFINLRKTGPIRNCPVQ